MAKKKKLTKRKFRKKITRPASCFFCKGGATPDYKEYKNLKPYLSDRAKILGKDRSGICSKHQRKLSREIKRARHLGLLPFRSSI